MEVKTRELLYNYNPNQTSSEEDKNSGPSESESLSSDKKDRIDYAKSSTKQDSPSKKNTKFYHSNPNSIHYIRPFGSTSFSNPSDPSMRAIRGTQHSESRLASFKQLSSGISKMSNTRRHSEQSVASTPQEHSIPQLKSSKFYMNHLKKSDNEEYANSGQYPGDMPVSLDGSFAKDENLIIHLIQDSEDPSSGSNTRLTKPQETSDPHSNSKSTLILGKRYSTNYNTMLSINSGCELHSFGRDSEKYRLFKGTVAYSSHRDPNVNPVPSPTPSPEFIPGNNILLPQLGFESPSNEGDSIAKKPSTNILSKSSEQGFFNLLKLQKLGGDIADTTSIIYRPGLFSESRISAATTDILKYEKASIGMTIMDQTPTVEKGVSQLKAGNKSGAGDSGDSAVATIRATETGKYVKSVQVGCEKGSVQSQEYFESQKAVFTVDSEEEKAKKDVKYKLRGGSKSKNVPPGKGPFEMLARFANPTKRLGQHGQESALFGDLWQKKQVIEENDGFLDPKSNQQEPTPIGPRLGLGLIKELSEPSSKKPLYGFDLRNVHNFFGVSEKDSLEAGVNIRNLSSPESGLVGSHRGI